MATYRIQGPDGQAYNVTAPDDADQGQVLAYFRANMGGGTKAPAAPAKPTGSDLAYRDAQRRERNTPALLRQFTAGVSFNLADELDAAGAGLETALNNGARRLTGREGVGYTSRQAYDAVMRAQREQDGEYRKAHPVASTAANIAGGVAAPGAKLAVGVVARGGTLAAKAGRSALVGSTAGAAYGAGSGEGARDRLEKAGGGAVGGAVLGAATPYALAVGGRMLAPVIDPLLERARPAAAAVRAAAGAGKGASVEERAREAGTAMARAKAERLSKPEQRVATALQRALERDAQAGHAPREGVPLYLGGGENVAGLAELVAQHPGAGKGIMSDAAEESLERNLSGFRDDLAQSLGGRGGYLEHLADLKGERATAGRGKLEEAFDGALDADVFNEQFGGLMRRLPKGTWEKAADLARMEGRDPYELGLIRSDTFDGLEAAGRSSGVDPGDLAAVARGVRGAPAASQGRSLAAFLARRGGLRDDAGGLTDMGAHTWHKGRPFAGRLVREDGAPLDDAANAAREAGYFPESLGGDDYHPVSADDLMEALRAELAGKPRYSQPRQAPGREASLDDLRGRLNASGVDPQDPQAARRLAEYDDFDGMAAAHQDGAGPGMSPDELLPVETPTLRAAHYVKKALDARLDPMRNPVSGRLNTEGNPEAGAISKLRSEWGRSMRSASPRYDEAMGQWGDDSEVIEGLELGRKALRGGDAWSAEAVAMRHSELSDEAKRQFQRGVGEAILQEARTKGGLAAMRRLLRNEDVADKVRLAFPSPGEFEAFLGTTRQRIADEGRNNRILHNSRTYGRQAAADDLADDGPDVLGTAADIATLDGRGLLRLARRALSERRAQPVLSDQAANPLLAEALTKPEAAARVRRLLAMQRARSLSSRAQGVSGQAVVGSSAGPRD